MAKQAEHEVRSGLGAMMPRLWRYGMVLARRRDLADDLAQSTALRALEKAYQFRPGSRLDAWLFTIETSIWRNRLRAEKVRAGAGVIPVEDANLSDERPDTETNILAREVLAKVMDLPEAQRDAVFLAYVEGYAYREVAEILEVPVGTVMSRLAAGRRKINEALGERAIAPGAQDG